MLPANRVGPAAGPTRAQLGVPAAADPVAVLAQWLGDRDPAVGLATVLAVRRLTEELERLHVDSARDGGWACQQIAVALQVTRQSVHEKHAGRRKAQGKES
jgi:hypothetical protein